MFGLTLANRARRDFAADVLADELRAKRDRAAMTQWIAVNVVFWVILAVGLQLT